MHKTLRGTLASHSTQGSHSKGLNHGFWGLHAPLQPQNGRASSSSPSRVGALLIRRYGRIEEMGARLEPPADSDRVGTHDCDAARARRLRYTPAPAYFGYLTLALEFTSLTLTWPNSDAHIPIRTPIFRRGHATNQSGY
jgi:hypothetical protein